jgi:hypothetical protein
MTRVKMLCEDRTGGGLFQVIEKSTQAARNAVGKAPLRFTPGGTIESNTRLLAQCAKYAWYRFQTDPPCDHVVYVIDALRLWDVPAIGIQAPLPNERIGPYLDKLAVKARTEMTRIARGTDPEDSWLRISDGFHAHILVWERESLMLPVSEALGLGPLPPDPQSERYAARWVEDRHRAHRRGQAYVKSVQGPKFLERIANNQSLRDRVLAQVPSLRTIVDSLVALP